MASAFFRATSASTVCAAVAPGRSLLRAPASRHRVPGGFLRRWASTAKLAPLVEAAGSHAATNVTRVPSLGSQPSPSSSSTSSAVAKADEQNGLALPPSGANGISYRGPIEEDMEGGGARHATVINAMWSNIPAHVRASFRSHGSIDDAPKSAAPLMLDGIMAKAKALVASTGFAPAGWTQPGETAMYYGGRIDLAPYKKGQTAAYHYPRILVPREMANRIPVDMYVDPVFQTSDPQQKHRMASTTLFPRLQGKTTLLLVFSGQPLSGLWTGVRQWLDNVGNDFLSLPQTQVFKMHAEEGWFNRRTHQLTKFQLRRQVDESELFTTFVYHGKWKWEIVYNMHLYNKDLPVLLLVDGLGYVRWHAVGLPTDDATSVFKDLAPRLARAKRSHT